MKKFALVLSIACALNTTAIAFDIAISTQAQYMPQDVADREMQEIYDNVTDVSVELFPVDKQDALANWVAAHTGDGRSDLLILCGQFPDTIYEPGNGQADNSLAELFLDAGNCIINCGDYIFYVVNGTGANGVGGLETMMDIPGIRMWTPIDVTVTAEGQELTPSLQDFRTSRPFHLDQLQGDWEPELVLAQDSSGMSADPVVVVNRETGGRVGIFCQANNQYDLPRGEVISEWIKNWYIPTVGIIGGNPLARRPDPEDGSLHEDTWINLMWTPGFYAASHDVYMGDNFNDVNDTTRDSESFRGNQTATFYVAGFPGFAYPEGLIPGTTYYWRIDEVNAPPDETIYKGDIWSFSIPSYKAYNPVPGDESQFVDKSDLILSWMPGLGAKMHTIYFGDDLDTVTDATDGLLQKESTYDPGPLDLETTYYWRIDEFDGINTYKGDVWSFTTTLESLGTAVMSRWENIEGRYLDELKNDPRYPDHPDVVEMVDRFAWDANDLDNYGARIEGWLHVPKTGDYTFWICSEWEGEFWLSTDDDPSNAMLIAQESTWAPVGVWGTAEEQSDPILLVGGEKYYALAVWKGDDAGEDHCLVAWQGAGVPDRVIIPGTNLSPYEPLNAFGPKPNNKATGVTQKPLLKWKTGLQAVSHEVYFGVDEAGVASATKASPEFKATQALGDERFDPGKLEWDTTYYWRVDEVNTLNPDSPWVGKVWSFTTADYLIVDDFENYTDDDPNNEAIWQHWIDGFGVADNGSQVGNLMPPYCERTIVHGGDQSMPLFYVNEASVANSEAVLTLTWPRDWTEGGVADLSLWFRGESANAAEPLYVAISNTTGVPALIAYDDPMVATVDTWTEWDIPLQVFADQGINLTNVDTLAIGLGDKAGIAAPGGSGTIYVDDIRLYQP